jgi:hypothetical protein
LNSGDAGRAVEHTDFGEAASAVWAAAHVQDDLQRGG